MRVLMICQHYWPEPFQITEVCEGLVVRGHEVTVLVGVPNYPEGVVPDEYRNGANREQVHNGVRIIRCDERPRKPGVIGLARNYASYMQSARRRARKFGRGEFDVIFGYQISPVFMFAPAADAKRATGAPALLYCADIWPDAVRAMLPRGLGFAFPAIRRISTKIYSAADLAVVNSRSYIEYFKDVHGFDLDRLAYVPWYADDAYLDMDLAPGPHERARLVVMGNIGRLQDMPSMLRAVARLKARDDFELHVVGGGSAVGWCERFVEDEGLGGKVVFHGRRPSGEMPDFYRMADACLLTLNVPGAPWISSTLPSRLQGYMAAGKPVLAAVSGSAAEIIAESGCGTAVPAGDDGAYADAIAGFLDDRGAYAGCGEAGRAYFRANFTKKRYIDEIERLLLRLAEEKDRQ